MGVLARIFGGGNVVSEGFNLIDKLHTSDEELIKAKSGAQIDLLSAYAPFKVAQRVLAIMFTVNFIVGFWVSVYLWANGKDLNGFVDLLNSFHIGWIMLTIVGFYFGGGAFEGVIKKIKQKKQD